MKQELLELLRCPVSGQRLVLQEPNYSGAELIEGLLVSEDGNFNYPVVKGVPRFVPQSNYADNLFFEP